jgi:hypothetical protein
VARPAGVAALAATAFSLAVLSSCSSDDGEPANSPGAMLWTDADGKIQPTTAVVGEAGPEHCEWQSATFLDLGGGIVAGGEQYLRDPEGVVPGRLATSYGSHVDLPSDARDTGFRRDGAALWVASDAAYIVAANGTERWPRTVDGIGCA